MRGLGGAPKTLSAHPRSSITCKAWDGTSSTGCHSKKDLQYTQKPTYLPILPTIFGPIYYGPP